MSGQITNRNWATCSKLNDLAKGNVSPDQLKHIFHRDPATSYTRSPKVDLWVDRHPLSITSLPIMVYPLSPRDNPEQINALNALDHPYYLYPIARRIAT